MSRAFTPTEDRFLVVGKMLGVSNKGLARQIDRSVAAITCRLNKLRNAEADAAARPSGYPRKAGCYSKGCLRTIMQQHAGHRHCDSCRRGLSCVSPFAPDLHSDHPERAE